MKNKFTKKHKHVLIIKGTQGMAKLSLAVVLGLILNFINYLKSSAPCARMLSFFGSLFAFIKRPSVCSTSCARALSGLWFSMYKGYRASSTSCARALSLLGILIIIAGTMIVTVRTNQVTAATSNQLNFQGRLLTSSGDLVPDGNYHVEFKLYNDTASAGTPDQGACTYGGGTPDTECLWTETRSTGNLVSIQNGYYSVYLGSVTSLPNIDWSQDLYLSMNIGGSGGGASWDGEMTPRFKLTAVPYAFKASNVASSSTNAASSNSDDVSITTGNALGVTSNSGNITLDVGTATGTAGTISLGSANASALTLGRTGVTTTNAGALTVTQQLTANGNLSIAGGTDFGVYYRDAADNLVTTAAGASGECFRGATGSAPVWGTCAGTGDIVQNGNSFAAAMRIGTNDAYDLQLEVNDTVALTIDYTTLAVTLVGDIAVNGDDITSDGDLTITPAGGDLIIAGNLQVTAGNFLSLAGGNTASRPGSPTEGMIYFDTDTDSLLTYANGKWQADRSTATYIVAANNSVNKEKADYVADGTGDQTEINSAITAASSAGGGNVYLLEGTYSVNASINISSNVNLAGSGDGTIIQIPNSFNSAINVITNPSSLTRARIADMVIDGNRTNQTSGTNNGFYAGATIGSGSGTTAVTGITITNTTFKNFRNAGFEGNTIVVTNSSFDNTNFVNNGNRGIYLEQSTFVSVTNSKFRGNSTMGIALNNNNNDNTIANNIFDSNTGAVSVNCCGTRNTITGNTIRSNTSIGISIYGSYNTITGNTITGNGSDGIRLTIGGYNLVGSNTILSNTGSGIAIVTNSSNNTVTGNQIISNSLHGIHLDGSTSNTVISSNRIDSNGASGAYDGISMTAATSSSYNSITGNIITDSAGSGYAINIPSSTMVGNILSNNSYSGTGATTINDAGTGTRYASQLTPAAVLQSGSSLIKANATTELTGDIDPAASTTVTGTSTKFTTELQVGDRITVSGETRTVTVITDDLNLDVDTAFTDNANDTTPDRLPAALRVTNSSGVNQVVVADNGNVTLTADLAVNGGDITSTGDLTITPAGGDTIVTGTLAVTTLGSADTATFVCRNTSNQLASCNYSPLNASLTDNIADALDIQEGTNNYFNINTTNSSENISFGNATTNPSYSFLGSGTLTVTGATTVNGLLTGTLGATISGATTSINTSSNFDTNINTGTSTGAVSIGNSAAGAITLQSASTVGLTGTTTVTGLSAGAGTALTVNNSTSTGSIFVAQDNGTVVLTVADGGAVILQNSTNSSAGLTVNDSAGNGILIVDTQSKRILPGITASYTSISRSTTEITNGDSVGSYVSIAISADGYPVIAAYNATDADLNVIKCSDISCSSSTTTEMTNSDDVGGLNSIAIGTDGYPIIASRNNTDFDLNITKCNNASCSSSTTTELTNADNVALSSNAIAIGADGYPVIAYRNTTDGDLNVTKCSNISCSSSSTVEISDADNVGGGASITIGNDGYPVIAYNNATDGDLVVAKCSDAACTSTTVTQLSNADSTGASTSIVIGTDGNPIISHINSTDSEINVTKCTNTSCTSSTTTEVTTVDSYTRASISIGSDGLPVIASYNSTDGDVNIIKCTDASCATSTITEISNADNLGSSIWMAIGTDGFPVISAYNSTDTDVNVLKCADLDCSGSTGTALTGGVDLGTVSSAFRSVYFDTLNLGSSGARVVLNDTGDFWANNLFSGNTGLIGIGTVTPADQFEIVSVSDGGASFDGQSITFTQSDDADATDTNAALNLIVSSSSGDADSLQGLNIANITGGSATERAIQIGSGWDANIFLNDTTSQIQVLNTGVITFEDDAGNDLLTITDSGTTGAVGITGTLTVQGASATLGVASTTTGTAIFRNAGGAGGITLTPANPGASSYTITLPAETGTICTTGSVCSGYQAAGTYLTASLADNTTDAFDLQEGTNNYFNINTTDASENISFGNATTNPSYNFLGTGILAVAGSQTVGVNLDVAGTIFAGTGDAFQVSSGGAVTAVGVDAGTGLLQGSLGLTVTGATTNINVSSNFDTNINTGTSSGTVNIGNSASTTTVLGTTNINTTGSANTAIGNGTGTFALDSSNFDVSTAGALSGITTIGLSGAITGATATDTINGLIINAGALSGITGYTQTSGNFAMSGAGTFGTGTGAVSLNGATSVTGTNTLTVGTGLTSLGGGLAVTAGDTTLAGDLAVNGDDITSDGDLTITPAGGDTNIVGRLAVSGSTGGAYGTLASFVSTTTSVGADAVGTYTELTVSPGSASTDGYYGTKTVATSASNNLTSNADLTGLSASGQYTGSGTIDSIGGAWLYGENTSNGTVNRGYGLWVDAPYNTGAGTIINSRGIIVSDTTSGTNNTNLILGAGAGAAGNWSLYNSSAYNNYIAGNVGIGQATAATIDGSTLVVNNQANADNILLLQDNGSAVLTVADGGALTATQLVTLNGGLTVETGDNFTFNGDVFTDFTGGGLVNTAGVLTVDTTTAAGFFQNGGNTFTADATLGVNANYALNIETNSLTRLTVDADGDVAFDTNTLFVDATNDQVSIGTASNLGAKLAVVGTADQEQLLIRAFASQTVANPLVVLQNSAGTELARINVDGSDNIAFGLNTLSSITSGANNIGIGASTLGDVTTGGSNIAIGGTSQQNGTGSQNVSLGVSTLSSATFSGSWNTAIGDSVLAANTTGVENTALGRASLGANQDGAQNTAVGNSALGGNISGAQNTAVGNGAGSLSTGGNNVFIGFNAGDNLTAGGSNIIIGSGVDAMSATGSSQLNIGDSLYGDLSNDRIAVGTSTTSAARLTVDNAASTDAIFVANDNGSAVFTIADGGAVTATQLVTLNGGLTVEAGDTFTFNSDAFTDLTGAGLVVSSNALTLDITSATGAFINGGNAFTSASTLGNTGSYDLNIETNSLTRLTVEADGDVAFDTNTLFVDATNNRVGIGISNPSYQFVMNSNTLPLEFSWIDDVSMLMADTYTGTGGDNDTTLALFNNQLNPSAIDSENRYAVLGVTEIAASSTFALNGNIVGGSVGAYNNGTGSIANLIGLLGISRNATNSNITSANGFIGSVENESTGVITTGVAIQGHISNSGAGTITDSYGLRTYVSANAGTLTNTYGLYVGDVTTGTQTNQAYGLYVSDTGARNYFGGSLQIAGASTVPTSDLSFGEGADRTIDVITRSSNAAGNGLSITAGSAGSGGSAFSGGVLNLQGGNAAGTGNANGGNIVLSGGTGVGTGVQGLVVVNTTAFSAASVQAFTGSANITQANIDTYGTILISSDAAGYTATLTDPTNTTTGRVVYVTNTGAYDMTLSVNGGGSGNTVTLKPNTTATMIWNGIDWTAAGASSSTDLQAAYNNTATSAGGAELVLNAPGGSADGLTIRNNPTTPITGGLLEVQTSIGSNLFTVNNNATEYATNGGAETAGGTSSTFPASTWDTTTGGTVSRYTTTGSYVATGQASVSVVTTTTNHGARNRINATLTSGLTYTVSFAVRGTTSFSTLDVSYSPDGTTSGTTVCATAQTVTTGQWTRITCSFVASGTITSSNSILISQTDATGRTFYVDNLSVNVNASVTYAADGSVDDAGAFATNWSNYQPSGTATTAQETSIIYDTNGSARVTTSATAGIGMRNNLSVPPQTDTQYLVSFYARASVAMTDSLLVGFLPAGGTGAPSGDAACTDYSDQSLTTTEWVKITCLFTTGATAISNADVVIYQSDATARIIYVDAFSVTLNTNNSNNVQVGGANKGGPVTLFTLDRSSGAPIAANNDAYLGSMYYDTESGRIQCYEADGWGACGAAPDNIVNLNPEYAGAVLNGSGVGTMTADFCGNGGGLSVNTTLCASGEAKNFYKWTSPQASEQTYSIYVTYQLPSTFNGFTNDDTVQLAARVDSTTNASVTYEMYKSVGGVLTQCGTGETDVIVGGGDTANVWHTYGINGNEATGCSFNSSSADGFVIFKINTKASSNASAYVGTLNFVTAGR